MVEKYIKQYIAKSYEVDSHGFLRVVTLMNWLQDMAVENAEKLGFGFEVCRQQNLAWVGSNYLIKIEHFPRLDEPVTIETWPAKAKLWGAIRDFIIKDAENNVIIRACSQWVLIDIEHRRPVMLKKHFPQYEFLPERAIDIEFSKPEAISSFSAKYEHAVRFDDIDINNHVNNAVYPLWASESVEKSFRLTHAPQEIEISFLKEALYGECVEVLTNLNGDESKHLIKDKVSGQDLANCRIKWRKITS